jgi:hypothetical protein
MSGTDDAVFGSVGVGTAVGGDGSVGGGSKDGEGTLGIDELLFPPRLKISGMLLS